MNLIDIELDVVLPNGAADRVNRFDYNLTMAATRGEGYIQLCESTGWIQAKRLAVQHGKDGA